MDVFSFLDDPDNSAEHCLDTVEHSAKHSLDVIKHSDKNRPWVETSSSQPTARIIQT